MTSEVYYHYIETSRQEYKEAFERALDFLASKGLLEEFITLQGEGEK